ncbi:MAG TPA: hypothetical protein VK464_01435 [Symbiobacteriaceae bacterium]|nr:hypothetical protein [Symbiobacteriaceae bacterium]
MRIKDSFVSMSSHQQLQQSYARQESLHAWVGENPNERPRPRPISADLLELSSEAKRQLAELQAAPATPAPKESPAPGVDKEDWLRILILRHLLGVDVAVADTAKIAAESQKAKEAAANAAAETPRQSGGPQREGWGVDYQVHESYQETERLEVNMAGLITTADGKEIAFSVNLTMSRQFAYESRFRFRAGDALRPVDPLVINFGGNAAELSTTRFDFDLDGDGTGEYIPTLQPGSGYLALDANGDGTVNNGTELFGPQSGDGFSELAKLDSDGNGWVDVADPLFSKLRVWTRDASGQQRLFALGQLGIGAVYVGSVDAGFTMKDSQNRGLAVNQKAGLFLRENGTVGTVQQLDLLV